MVARPFRVRAAAIRAALLLGLLAPAAYDDAHGARCTATTSRARSLPSGIVAKM